MAKDTSTNTNANAARANRPPFIVSAESVEETLGRYPDSDEPLAYGRPIGKAAGLMKIGLHLERLPPGCRLSWPHAESEEEEFVFILEGRVDAWVDGEVHAMTSGELAAFPSGTGICHTFINNSDEEAKLLVGGEQTKSTNRIVYPLNPERRGQLRWSEWWDDAPKRSLGDHDALPSGSQGARKDSPTKTPIPR